MLKVVFWSSVAIAMLGGCNGQTKQEIGLLAGQVYSLAPSGKLKVFPPSESNGAAGAQPIKKLQVKRKNEGAAASTPGCWQCTDCICNSDECACTECTSC